MNSPAPSKQDIRKDVLSRRRVLPEKEWLEKSGIIVSAVLGIGRVVEAEHILLYLSMTESREVFTGELAACLAGAGKKLSVPVILGNRLVPAGYRPGDRLRRGLFGQPEPENVSPADAGKTDVVIMPLVAVDARGVRLGYGKGYFDRFLAELGAEGKFPCRIGLAFSLQVVPALPADRWDEPLDYAVHENGIMQFTK